MLSAAKPVVCSQYAAPSTASLPTPIEAPPRETDASSSQTSTVASSAQSSHADQQSTLTSRTPVSEAMLERPSECSQLSDSQANQDGGTATSGTAHGLLSDGNMFTGQTLHTTKAMAALPEGKSKIATSASKTVRLQHITRKALAALQHYDSAPALTQRSSSAVVDSARRATSPSLLRNQHLPGVAMHQKTAFPANMTMKHEAGISSAAHGRHPRASSDATLARVFAATAPLARPQSPTALHNQQLQQLWRQHSAAEPGTSLGRQRSPAALQRSGSNTSKLSASTRASPQATKQAHMSRKMSSVKPAGVTRKAPTKVFIEPFYETTSHPSSLGRSQTWASQWLAQGSPDDLTDPVKTHSLPDPLLQYTSTASAEPLATLPEDNGPTHHDTTAEQSHSQAQTALKSTGNTVLVSPDLPVLLPKEQIASSDTSHGQTATVISPSIEGNTALKSVSECDATPSASIGMPHTSTHRPHTVPANIYTISPQHWQLDLRRLHSARPGSGGSPTARSASCSPAQCWQRCRLSVVCQCMHCTAASSTG